MNNYKLDQQTLEKALKYMQSEGCLKPNSTTDDLISFTRSMVEDIPFMVTAKIKQWANA
jgi:hypothetical protein